MTAAKRRVGFCLLAAALAALLFFFSPAYLLWALAVLLMLAALCALLVRVDARRLALTVAVSAGEQVDRPARLTLSAPCRGRLLAANCAAVELEIVNVMFGTTRREQLLLPLRDGGASFETGLELELCGETILRCASARVWDPLGLFSAPCAPFAETRTLCWPKPVSLALTLSRDTVGAANAEGLMQNRRGGDPSEIFDIREYVPGDDVRAIHWKLSCKTDTLILRESSEPSHYDVALLPDLGLMQDDREVAAEELNSAAALALTLGEQLLEQGVPFCLAIPTKQGLHLCQVPDRRELRRVLPQWLGLAVPTQSGAGLNFFLSEHLEQYFTRLLIVSAGKYSQDVDSLSKRVGVTAISTAADADAPVYTTLGPGCEAVVLPCRQERGSSYKIVC